LKFNCIPSGLLLLTGVIVDFQRLEMQQQPKGCEKTFRFLQLSGFEIICFQEEISQQKRQVWVSFIVDC
jgi:hypothetical protein